MTYANILLFIVALSGCASQYFFPTTLADYEKAGLITKVDIRHNYDDSIDVTLHSNANFKNQSLGGPFVQGIAIDAAQQYRTRLNAPYVSLVIKDATGKEVARSEAGTPKGYHWIQNGIDYENGPLGPRNITPHYGLERTDSHRFPRHMTVQQPPFFKMILLSVVLHVTLGWQLWVGVAIARLGERVPGDLCPGQGRPPN